MVSIDAAQLSTRELNIKLNALVEDNQDVKIINPRARHNVVAVSYTHLTLPTTPYV